MNGTPSPVPPTEDLGEEFISELNKLSIEERDEVTNDVHGVNTIVNEDPEFTAKAIDILESELNAIPDKDKEAYTSALNQNSDYVMDKKFLLMFLRSTRFDTKWAAARFVAFFQTKLELFGEEKLGRDIRMDDLDEYDTACLEAGYIQILNARDRAGRLICMCIPTIREFKTLENKLRTLYMATMFAVKDIDTQKNGIVSIMYNIGRGIRQDPQAAIRFAKMGGTMPVKVTAIHCCYDDEQIRGMFYIGLYVMTKASRMRCRFHLGTHMEIIYTLMTFGIPKEAFPVNFSGGLRLELHREFIRKMRKADGANERIDRIIVPGTYDVLLGRGKPLQKYCGNLNYHYVVEGYHDRYEAAAKGEKAELAMEIVKKIQSQGGRFLKQDNAGWMVIDDEAARYKVSHTFRNHRIAARTAIKKAAVSVPCNSRFMHGFSGTTTIESQTDSEHKKRKLKEGSGDEDEDKCKFCRILEL